MGYRKMKEAMVAAGLREPTFASDAFFRATFQRSPEFAMKEGPPGTGEAGKGPGVKSTQETIQKTPQENRCPNSAESRGNPPRAGSQLGITDSGVKYH